MDAGRHDVVLIGGSSGSLAPLKQIIAALPAQLPAIVCVAVHLAPWRKSQLPRLLENAGPLPATHPENGQRLEYGRIYVAAPDYHLLIDDTRAYVRRGPKENFHRPSIDALFRSAAVMCRERVIGVVLSGSMDDGATGLSWIKRYGGVAIVQDPSEAAFRSMAETALRMVDVDYCVAVEDIAPLLVRLAGGAHPAVAGRGLDNSEDSHADEQTY
jgi:two-component system chemotaxis response regulator CheB